MKTVFLCQKRRVLRRALSLVLSLLLLSSCLFAMVSCDSPTYMTIGGQDVSYDMVRSFVMNYTDSYSEEQLADEALRQELRDSILYDLKMMYVIRAVADELGVKIDSTEKKAIQAEMDAYRDTDGYEDMLALMYATDEVLEEMVTVDHLDGLVYQNLTEKVTDPRFAGDTQTVDADLATGNWYAAEYVILMYDDVNHDVRKAELQEARDAVLGGQSLRDATLTISKLYSTQYYYQSDGCFTDTIYSEDMENAVKALEIGDTSDVIETYTADGYACFMLLRRMEISDAYVDSQYNTVVAYYLAREYAEYMHEKAEALEVVISDRYADTDLLDVK